MDRTIRTSIIVVSSLIAVGCAKGPTGPRVAPDFSVERATAPIEKVKLSSLKGKVVLLDFWATWCGPCKVTMPGIDRLYATYKDRGFEVMGISSEKRADVRNFIKDVGYSYPFYVDVSLEASKVFNVEGIPRLVLVDRKGMIVLDETGITSEKVLEDAIKGAL